MFALNVSYSLSRIFIPQLKAYMFHFDFAGRDALTHTTRHVFAYCFCTIKGDGFGILTYTAANQIIHFCCSSMTGKMQAAETLTAEK